MLIIAFAVIAVLAGVRSDPFIDCGSQNVVLRFRFNDCFALPCDVPANATAVAIFEIINQRPTEKIVEVVTATLEDGTKIEIRSAPICANMVSGDCPLEVGEIFEFFSEVPNLGDIPMGSVELLWHLIDNEGNLGTCVRLPVIFE